MLLILTSTLEGFATHDHPALTLLFSSPHLFGVNQVLPNCTNWNITRMCSSRHSAAYPNKIFHHWCSKCCRVPSPTLALAKGIQKFFMPMGCVVALWRIAKQTPIAIEPIDSQSLKGKQKFVDVLTPILLLNRAKK